MALLPIRNSNVDIVNTVKLCIEEIFAANPTKENVLKLLSKILNPTSTEDQNFYYCSLNESRYFQKEITRSTALLLATLYVRVHDLVAFNVNENNYGHLNWKHCLTWLNQIAPEKQKNTITQNLKKEYLEKTICLTLKNERTYSYDFYIKGKWHLSLMSFKKETSLTFLDGIKTYYGIINYNSLRNQFNNSRKKLMISNNTEWIDHLFLCFFNRMTQSNTIENIENEKDICYLTSISFIFFLKSKLDRIFLQKEPFENNPFDLEYIIDKEKINLLKDNFGLVLLTRALIYKRLLAYNQYFKLKKKPNENPFIMKYGYFNNGEFCFLNSKYNMDSPLMLFLRDCQKNFQWKLLNYFFDSLFPAKPQINPSKKF